MTRVKKKGLLKPLLIPYRIWQEIPMDFITDLLPSTKLIMKTLLVIIDRLSKKVILIPILLISAPAVAMAFIGYYIPYHGFRKAIINNRGT